MNEAFGRPSLRETTLDLSWQWCHRVLAISSLMLGVLYWIRLIGVYDGSLWRFDLMPVHWQVASVTLAVLFPFAARGLLMMASWGPVIWFICAAIELVMDAGRPDLFGTRHEMVAVHIAVALAYVAFRVAFFLRARQAAD